MYLSEEDQIIYLANLIFIANANGAVSPTAEIALDEIRESIRAKKSTYETARRRALSGAYSLSKIGSFVAQVSNLTEMLYVCAVDRDISSAEKQMVSEFARSIDLTEKQIDILMAEIIARIKQKQIVIVCPSCKMNTNADSKFCPKCGASLTAALSSSKFEIPKIGYAIEFCESTSAGFPSALKFAQQAPTFSSCMKSKKNWYLASWPGDAFEDVICLADLLSGLRNKKCYLDGEEVDWDELFGFTWCANERNRAYRPTEYCFGKTENQLNPWGCIQARLEWTEWAKWFSYGRFEKQGVIRGTYVWVFDKARIKHELMTNLHRVRYCPHLRMPLMEAVLRSIPDRVQVTDNGFWKYSRTYEETPGSIKIVEIEKSDGVEFRQEYFADGVRPRGVHSLSEILNRAFVEAAIGDVRADAIALSS